MLGQTAQRGGCAWNPCTQLATFGANESSVGQTTRAPSSGPAEQLQGKGSNSGQKEVPKAGHKGRGIRRVGEESSCNPCQRGSAEV